MTKTTEPTLLFDLDGTLVDTDPLHFEAFLLLLRKHDRPPIDLELYKTRIMGFGHAEIFSMLFPDRGSADHRRLADEKEDLFRGLLRELEPRPGLFELLEWADERALPCGVVTNAPRANAMLMLRGLRLDQRFETIVFGEELPHGKPHPLPYETALSRLAGRLETAVAFEDSLSGVRSAAGARIYTVGVRSALTERALREAGASHTIDDFSDQVLWRELRQRAGEG
jgi:beta-phosphoglucomutase